MKSSLRSFSIINLLLLESCLISLTPHVFSQNSLPANPQITNLEDWRALITQDSAGNNSNSDDSSYETSSYDPSNFFIHADFLYWLGQENDASGALKYASSGVLHYPDFQGTAQTPADFEAYFKSGETFTLNPSWDPGFRVGLGYVFEKTLYDLGLTYTWYRTTRDGSASIPFSSTTTPLYVLFDAPFSLYSTARSSWKYYQNDFDLVLGNFIALSEYFTLRPHIGVKGGWGKRKLESIAGPFSIHQGRLIFAYDLDYGEAKAISSRKMYWVGPRLGLDMNYQCTSHFAILGTFYTAALWEKNQNYYRNSTQYRQVSSDPFTNVVYQKTTDTSFSANMMIDWQLGIKGRLMPIDPSNTKRDDDYYVILYALWEQEIWFDKASTPVGVQGNITLQGVTAGISISF